MIKGLSHTAITVSDLERSLAFYRDLLGFPVKRTLDLPDGSKIVILDIAGRGELELFRRPHPNPPPPGTQDQNAIGLRHFALEVDDVETEWARLETQGVQPLGEPLFRRPGGARCCHFLDPDGVVVEIIQTPETWWPQEVRLE
jgi:lactoylglutathione lyase